MVLKNIYDETKESVLEAQVIQYDPDDSTPVYIGTNNVADASNDALDWRIFKFTYSGSNVIKIVKKTGSWTLRATYF
jgi:hypothetical protein